MAVIVELSLERALIRISDDLFFQEAPEPAHRRTATFHALQSMEQPIAISLCVLRSERRVKTQSVARETFPA